MLFAQLGKLYSKLVIFSEKKRFLLAGLQNGTMQFIYLPFKKVLTGQPLAQSSENINIPTFTSAFISSTVSTVMRGPRPVYTGGSCSTSGCVSTPGSPISEAVSVDEAAAVTVSSGSFKEEKDWIGIYLGNLFLSSS